MHPDGSSGPAVIVSVQTAGSWIDLSGPALGHRCRCLRDVLPKPCLLFTLQRHGTTWKGRDQGGE